MTVVDLHPEDLLDKDSRDELTDDELVRLEAHVGRCAACRAERVLRLDFAAELDGDDRPSAILDLVHGALKGAGADARAKSDLAASAARTGAEPAVEDDAKVATIPGLRRRTRRATVVLFVAAAILAAGAAGAASLSSTVWLRLRGTPQEATHVEPNAVLPSPTTLATAPHAVPSALASAAALPTTEPVLAEVAPAPRAPIHAIVFTPPPSASLPAGAAPSPSPSPSSASAMFDAANAARRSGDTAGALALYDGLERQYPASREARLANATTARLLLDQGNAAGAVNRFDAYLASGASELREEAMAGRATALERLGRDEEEARAWALLLATYPRTPYAAHARARVGRSLPQ